MTEVDIVDYLLELGSELKASYNLYQSILYALQNKNYQLLENILNSDFKNVSKYLKTSVNTLEKSYNNSNMERYNNNCKLIKRIAFGVRNFRNFNASILIVTNYFRKPKEVTNFHSSPFNV